MNQLLVRKYFEQRFNTNNQSKLILEGVQFGTITKHDSCYLKAKLAIQEVKEAIWECRLSKSLRLDEINFRFLKQF